MLNLTLKTGDSVKIGDDIQIVFELTSSMDRIKIGVEAPKDKNIQRMTPEKTQTQRKRYVIVNNKSMQ